MEMLKEQEVAQKLKVSIAALRRWRRESRGPRFLKLGTLVRYRLADVAAWLETRPAGGGQ